MQVNLHRNKLSKLSALYIYSEFHSMHMATSFLRAQAITKQMEISVFEDGEGWQRPKFFLR